MSVIRGSLAIALVVVFGLLGFGQNCQQKDKNIKSSQPLEQRIQDITVSENKQKSKTLQKKLQFSRPAVRSKAANKFRHKHFVSADEYVAIPSKKIEKMDGSPNPVFQKNGYHFFVKTNDSEQLDDSISGLMVVYDEKIQSLRAVMPHVRVVLHDLERAEDLAAAFDFDYRVLSASMGLIVIEGFENFEQVATLTDEVKSSPLVKYADYELMNQVSRK